MNVGYRVVLVLSFISLGITLCGQSYLDQSFGVNGSVTIPVFQYEDIRFLGQDSTGFLYLQTDRSSTGAPNASLMKISKAGIPNGGRTKLDNSQFVDFYLNESVIYSREITGGSTLLNAFNLNLSPKFNRTIPSESLGSLYFFKDNSILGITKNDPTVTAFFLNSDALLNKDFGIEGLISFAEPECYTKLRLHPNGNIYILTSAYPSRDRTILRRYDNDGQADLIFGDDGKLELEVDIDLITKYFNRSMSILDDGSFLMSYILYDEEFANYLTYAKYDEDGNHDLSFGIDGYIGELQNVGDFGYTSQFITQTTEGHLLFHYTTKDADTNLKTDFLSLYNIDGKKLQDFAEDGALELTDLPDYIGMNITSHNDDIYLDYEKGIREEGVSFKSTDKILSKIDLNKYLEELSIPADDLSNFKVYPNPFIESLILDYEGPALNQTKVVIYDLLGRTIQSIQMDDFVTGIYSLELSDLAAGAYIIEVESQGEVVWSDKVIRK